MEYESTGMAGLLTIRYLLKMPCGRIFSISYKVPAIQQLGLVLAKMRISKDRLLLPSQNKLSCP